MANDSFTTESGSTYELDRAGKRLRRLDGVTPLTRVGPHGEWRQFADVSDVRVGEPVVIVWRWDNVDEQLIARSTVTSRVTGIAALDPNPS